MHSITASSDPHPDIKSITFEFDTSREVPFYGRTLTQYAQKLEQTVGEAQALCYQLDHGFRYSLQVKGRQQQLETFADTLAREFPLSCFLLDARVVPLNATQDEAELLPASAGLEPAQTLAFCAHCFSIIGDNQSPFFGSVKRGCTHCEGERSVKEELSLEQLRLAANAIIAGECAEMDGRQYSLQGNALRDTLIVTNPNNLNANLIANDSEVLALSSIEKPRLRLLPQAEHSRLKANSYRVRFASTRLELVLCELLRVKGIDYVFGLGGDAHLPDICALDGRWHIIKSVSAFNASLRTAAHEENTQYNGYQAILSKPDCLTITPLTQAGSVNAPALTALKGLTAQSGKQLAHHCSLYLGGAGPLEIASVDGIGTEEVFFRQTPLPDNGYEIYRLLMESPQRTLLEKFKAKYPQECLALLDIIFKPTFERGNLQGLWAMAACILGLAQGRDKPSVEYLSDALLSEAQKFTGQTAPRIDYPLVKGEAVRAINWCKTLGTLMSFRLAGDTDTPKLAFAMMDSLADYLANWVEHLDLNVGIQKVYVSGSELANPVLAKRLWLRLGKNFTIETNPQRDLDGAIFAIGKILTPTPRQFGSLGRDKRTNQDVN